MKCPEKILKIQYLKIKKKLYFKTSWHSSIYFLNIQITLLFNSKKNNLIAQFNKCS